MLNLLNDLKNYNDKFSENNQGIVIYPTPDIPKSSPEVNGKNMNSSHFAPEKMTWAGCLFILTPGS
jgi:hypothetical protein